VRGDRKAVLCERVELRPPCLAIGAGPGGFGVVQLLYDLCRRGRYAQGGVWFGWWCGVSTDDEFNAEAMRKRLAVMEREPVSVLSMMSDAGWGSLGWRERHGILVGLRRLADLAGDKSATEVGSGSGGGC
jgi:hypothetical protein